MPDWVGNAMDIVSVVLVITEIVFFVKIIAIAIGG